MNVMVISDIHGSAVYTEKLINCIKKEEPDQILVLGDVLYHGPRNPLPEGYDPMKVVELLQEYSDIMIGVKGNCDAQIDLDLMGFQDRDYIMLNIDDKEIFMTHGHVYSPDEHPVLTNETIFISGHTHLLTAEKRAGIYYLNPGSVSLPKGGNPHSYGIISSNELIIKDLDGNIIKSCLIKR